ncbi:peptidase M14 [Bordetella genomosp. 7]|uniref:M14 family zinc carboxypeptidase n=1 Tax=Bordetella TaxID=517 RepID=UPI0004B22797|nr:MULTISPECIES: M14 family zinc carboxypeptidase [Bordetella]OZI22206.1 peptidase M14 [Bordetella genomosp. 7]
MILLDTRIERTLDAWLRQYGDRAWAGATLEGWVFEGLQARRAAQARLAEMGVRATLRSAYKPLLHFFLEEADTTDLAAVIAHYPVHPLARPNRFTLEAYPLAGLLGTATLQFVPGTDDLHYRIELHYRDGRRSDHSVYAPNRIVSADDATPLLSPAGWLRVRDAAGNAVTDAAHATEFELAFSAAVDAVRAHEWPGQAPHFERLDIRIDVPGMEFDAGGDGGLVSTYEALHEDVYFTLIEFFQRHAGLPPGDRRLRPGQIVPDVRHTTGPARVHVSTRAFDPPAALVQAAPTPLEAIQAPLEPAQIAAHMAALGGMPIQARSRQGRPVLGAYIAGPGPAVFISGGQHANETSGVVGALRAAHALLDAGEAHFALVAAENPDGYALHRELCLQHPRHMHHAARYSALGDDVAYRTHAPFFEQEARRAALRASGARLHINLHGYPAHEWTRPLSGYLPRQFESWTLPKGFFLLLRHHPGWAEAAGTLMDALCGRLAQVPGLAAFNARQAALCEAHALEKAFATRHGIACVVVESVQEMAPLSLIAEYPDETVYGAEFRQAHTVQMETVLAAVAAYRSLAHRWADLPVDADNAP